MHKAHRSGVRRIAPLTDSGATAIEYALLASLIAGVITATVRLLGQQVLALFTSIPIPFG
jgi:hypothetical protein